MLVALLASATTAGVMPKRNVPAPSLTLVLGANWYTQTCTDELPAATVVLILLVEIAKPLGRKTVVPTPEAKPGPLAVNVIVPLSCKAW